MDAILRELRNLGIEDALRLIAIVVPLAGAIWAAMLWAFKSRLDSLESSLRLHREDAELRIAKDVDVQSKPLREEIERLKMKAEQVAKENTSVWRDLRFLYEMTESPEQYPAELRSLRKEIDTRHFHIRETRRKSLLLNLDFVDLVDSEPTYVKEYREKKKT